MFLLLAAQRAGQGRGLLLLVRGWGRRGCHLLTCKCRSPKATFSGGKKGAEIFLCNSNPSAIASAPTHSLGSAQGLCPARPRMVITSTRRQRGCVLVWTPMPSGAETSLLLYGYTASLQGVLLMAKRKTEEAIGKYLICQLLRLGRALLILLGLMLMYM